MFSQIEFYLLILSVPSLFRLLFYRFHFFESSNLLDLFRSLASMHTQRVSIHTNIMIIWHFYGDSVAALVLAIVITTIIYSNAILMSKHEMKFMKWIEMVREMENKWKASTLDKWSHFVDRM